MSLPTLARRLAAGALLLAFAASPARAQLEDSPRYASVVVEGRTGNMLAGAMPDELRHPASLTKMMTLYMMFEAMRAGRIELSTPIRFSSEAASRPPSKLGVPPGGHVSAETAILALVTRSANDVAAAVAEHIGGSEENFARQMTLRARSLGMSRTTFRNASGLPDPDQVTTARDMATLGRRLFLDFPDRYGYFATTHFAHGRQMIRNHNGMLLDYPGADGIKTGFINASGFNIVTSAQRDGVRLVGAVFGGQNWYQRNRHMADLLDDGFGRMGVRHLAATATAAPLVRSAMAASGVPAAAAAMTSRAAARRLGHDPGQRVAASLADARPAAAARRPARLVRAQEQGSRAAPVRAARQQPVRVLHRPAAAPARQAAPARATPARATPAPRRAVPVRPRNTRG